MDALENNGGNNNNDKQRWFLPPNEKLYVYFFLLGSCDDTHKPLPLGVLKVAAENFHVCQRVIQKIWKTAKDVGPDIKKLSEAFKCKRHSKPNMSSTCKNSKTSLTTNEEQ